MTEGGIRKGIGFRQFALRLVSRGTDWHGAGNCRLWHLVDKVPMAVRVGLPRGAFQLPDGRDLGVKDPVAPKQLFGIHGLALQDIGDRILENDLEVTGMERCMTYRAEKGPIGKIGLAAEIPRVDMVGLASVCCHGAAGVYASTVPQCHGSPLRPAEEALGPSQVKRLGIRAHHCGNHVGDAGKPAGVSGGNQMPVCRDSRVVELADQRIP